MQRNYNNIKDDEVRFIGQVGKKKRRAYLPWLLAGLLFIIFFVALYFVKSSYRFDSIPLHAINDNAYCESGLKKNEATEFLKSVSDNAPSSIEVFCDTFNNVPLRFFCPRNCNVELRVGKQEISDSVVLICEAAGIRADNGEIVGTFIINGNVLAKSRSKQGYCAIIDNQIYIGSEDATPYVEKALDGNGSFFRQYSLIHNFKIQKIIQNVKALRKALCKFRGECVVVETQTAVSMTEFTDILHEMDIAEAIYLNGAETWGWFTTENQIVEFGIKEQDVPQNINYIVWTKR